MAEWLASPDWDREGVGSNPGVARSDGQIFIMFKFNPINVCVRWLFLFVLIKLRHCGHLALSSCLRSMLNLCSVWLT